MLGVADGRAKPASPLLEISMQPMALAKVVYRLLISAQLVQVKQQLRLAVVRPSRVAEIVQEELFRAAVCLKETHLTIEAFLWLADRLGIFLLQTGILRAFWFGIFGVHVYDAEDAVIALRNAALDFLLQFLDAAVLGIVGLYGQPFEYIAQRVEVVEGRF